MSRNAADRISESKLNILQTSITSEFWYRLSVAMISLSNCERPKRFYTRLRHLSKVRINFLVLCRVACAEFARIWVSYNVIHLLYLWTNDGSINISTLNKKCSLHYNILQLLDYRREEFSSSKHIEMVTEYVIINIW